MVKEYPRSNWDMNVDAAFIRFSDVKPVKSREVKLFVRLYFDSRDTPVAIEILDFSKRFSDPRSARYVSTRSKFRAAKFASYDRDADAVYFDLSKTVAFEPAEISPGVIVDYDRQDRITGIKILDFAERFVTAEAKAVLKEQLAAKRVIATKRAEVIQRTVRQSTNS